MAAHRAMMDFSAMSAMSSPAELDNEAAVVALARQGDAKAFSELLERYETKIFRLALHITQNREDAEDVLQETFLKAYEHLDQFQGNSRFYTWIVRIAVNRPFTARCSCCAMWTNYRPRKPPRRSIFRFPR